MHPERGTMVCTQTPRTGSTTDSSAEAVPAQVGPYPALPCIRGSFSAAENDVVLAAGPRTSCSHTQKNVGSVIQRYKMAGGVSQKRTTVGPILGPCVIATQTRSTGESKGDSCVWRATHLLRATLLPSLTHTHAHTCTRTHCRDPQR